MIGTLQKGFFFVLFASIPFSLILSYGGIFVILDRIYYEHSLQTKKAFLYGAAVPVSVLFIATLCIKVLHVPKYLTLFLWAGVLNGVYNHLYPRSQEYKKQFLLWSSIIPVAIFLSYAFLVLKILKYAQVAPS